MTSVRFRAHKGADGKYRYRDVPLDSVVDEIAEMIVEVYGALKVVDPLYGERLVERVKEIFDGMAQRICIQG